MNNSVVKAAIIGLGRWGQNLHQASLDCESLKVTRVVTRSPAKVEKYCHQHDLVLSDSLGDALGDNEIDAVVLATPHTRHYDQICAAADSGKHVFSEKPFTLDGRQAADALQRIARNGLKVGIGHNRRFAPNTLRLKEMLANDELGDILHVDGVFSAQMAQSRGRWRDSREESPAGGMTSLGIHVVDMLINLVGEVGEVRARSERIHTECVFDDSTIANLRFRNGATGVLTTLASSPMMWRITLYGTRAWAELRDLDKLTLQPVEGEQQAEHFRGFEYPGIQSITNMLQAFAEDVLHDLPFPVSAAEISHATNVLQAIIDSAESDEAIRPG